MKYKAYLVEENEGTFQGSIKEIEMQSIEPGNLIIKVHYSSLNNFPIPLQISFGNPLSVVSC